MPVEFRALQPGLLVSVLNLALPFLCLAFLGFAGWKVYSSMSGRGSFDLENQSGKQTVGFEDVAGVDEAKAELTETIEFLKDPDRFGRLRCATWHLVIRAAGTGKTLLLVLAKKQAFSSRCFGFKFPEKFAGLGLLVFDTFSEGTKYHHASLHDRLMCLSSRDAAVTQHRPIKTRLSISPGRNGWF